MPVRYLLFIALFTFLANQGIAQQPTLKFKHITDEQGLSNTSVECIAQDYRGFMWFGTLDGLNRYDGYTITIYRNNPKDTGSISDNTISCIYEDHNHRLWIGTNNGLNLFNETTNKFSRYLPIKGSNSISNARINDIAADAANNLWIATDNGLNELKARSAGFVNFAHNSEQVSSPASNHINAICKDKQGNLWLATDKGLDFFNLTTKTFRLYQNLIGNSNSNAGQDDYNNIQQVRADHEGNLWLITNDQGLIVFNPRKNSAHLFTHHDKDQNSIGSNILRDVFVDKQGSVWVGGVNAGLNLYNKNTNSFFNYHHEPDNSTSLSQKSVRCLTQDKQGNLWVGTLRGGVNLYNPQLGRFKLYKQTVLPSSLSYDDIRSFYQDKSGNIWVGADGGGLDLFNEATGTFRHYRHDPNNPSSISSTAIISITGDSENNIWIATWQGGLNLFDPKTGLFTHFNHRENDKTSISSDFVTKAFEDSEHHLWVATDVGGVNLFNRQTRQFSRFTHDPQSKTRIWGNNIIDINQDNHHNIWFLTLDSGANCYNLQTKQITHYLFTPGVATTDIAFAFTDSKGRFWIGKKGLYLFDHTHNRFICYTGLGGLATEYIKGILEDAHGNLWISTSNGITKFNPDTHAFKKFNAGDGLQGLEFEVASCLKARNGEMLFGGVNGFNIFYPDDIKLNPYIPPVYLTDFEVLNKSMQVGDEDSPLKTDISSAKTVSLKYNQSTFSFQFSALNYVVPENNQYRYKLENFDKNWIKAGTERKASYTNIDPGTYTFKVEASNNDGQWNEAPTEVTIIISPPFWSTWWFRLIIFLVLAICAYVVLYLRHEFELRVMEEKKNEEMHQVQLQFFTNISHEFRTPLSLILGPLEKITHETSATKITHYYNTIHRNAHRLMSLINELMDFRKVESGALKLKVRNADLNVFLNNIIEEFKDLSSHKKITLTIPKPSKFESSWFDSMLLEKIVLNLLNNAFKYTADDGVIEVKLLNTLDGLSPSFENELVIKNPKRAPDYFYILVKDNGIGISKESIGHLFERYYRIASAHLGSGVGLAFVKSLTMLHNGDIYVYSERNKGTEILIALPYGVSNYTEDEQWHEVQAEGGVSFESAARQTAPLQAITEEITQSEQSDIITHRILLVDDNDELRDFLKGALASRYEILEATDGHDALNKLSHEFADLIISDIMMPGMNGIEFCKAVKNDMETSHIPFILLTAKDGLESKIEGAESGADIYLSKPVSINLLLLTIRNIFEQQQKQKDHYIKDYYTEAKGLVTSSKDKDFMDKLVNIIESQLVNPELDVEFLCNEIYMSKTKLYQKIKSITGQSIAEFVRTFRLKKAIQIMTHEDVLLTEVTYRVGFVDASYFSRVFKKEYGKTPTQFLQDIKRSAK
jgi:ligand-binding sensor domain-containing protein/signal transduction histidine kinase/DNA-binding response OmpR family regulator